MRRLLLTGLGVLLCAAAGRAGGQQLLIDRGVRAGELWCFPLDGEPQQYVYLPVGLRLARDDGGAPRFSFLRYALERSHATEDGAAIAGAAGGALLHFLLVYETPAEVVAEAERELRRRLEDDEVALRGPAVFESGRYSLVSSVLSGDGAAGREVLASGRAPVLEGNQVAFSFELDPERASLLFKSFQSATPDVSLVFEMDFSGLTDAYEATLTVDWSEVRSSQALSAGGSVYFVSAEVEAAFERLLRENAIRLETAGSDAASEALLARVYDRLLELLFEPVEPEEVPADRRGGLVDALSALIDGRSGLLSSSNTTGFGAHAGFQLKDLRSEGVSVLRFDHRATVRRTSSMAFNLGDLYRRYGDDPRFFRAFRIDDPTYRQRQVRVVVDGALLPELGRTINSVTVDLRKRHEDGSLTVRELVLDRAAIEAAGGDLAMTYGWSGDHDRLGWLDYEFRTDWSFQGGGSYRTDWQTSAAAAIDLYAPYERRTVELVGDVDELAGRGVRAVMVRLEYPFFGERGSEQVILRAGEDDAEPKLEITLPREEYGYDYQITWILPEGERRTRSGRDDTGVLFVDELPDRPAAMDE